MFVSTWSTCEIADEEQMLRLKSEIVLFIKDLFNATLFYIILCNVVG